MLTPGHICGWTINRSVITFHIGTCKQLFTAIQLARDTKYKNFGFTQENRNSLFQKKNCVNIFTKKLFFFWRKMNASFVLLNRYGIFKRNVNGLHWKGLSLRTANLLYITFFLYYKFFSVLALRIQQKKKVFQLQLLLCFEDSIHYFFVYILF